MYAGVFVRRSLWGLALSVLLFMTSAVWAGDPSELIAQRAEYMRAAARASVGPLTAYLRVLEPLRQQYAREGRTDAAVAVQNEMKSIQMQLDAAQANSNLSTSAPVQLYIESVSYGHQQTKRVADATTAVRSALEAGSPSIVIATKDLGLQGADPAPGAHKTAVIVYTINGRKKEKIVDENTPLNFKDLK
jgi:hypothetical protein